MLVRTMLCFFQQKTEYEIRLSHVSSEICIRYKLDRGEYINEESSYMEKGGVHHVYNLMMNCNTDIHKMMNAERWGS